MQFEVVMGFISTIVIIIISITYLSYWLGKKFTQINKRFEEIDRRFEEIYKRLEGFNGEFKNIDKRFNELRVEFRDEIRRSFNAVVSTTQSINSLLIDFLTLKGLITREERDFLIKDVERMCRISLISLNPLKPEDAQFILKVMNDVKTKDPKDVNIDDLDRIMEIARRWFLEDYDPKAYRLMLNVYAIKASLLKERGEL